MSCPAQWFVYCGEYRAERSWT